MQIADDPFESANAEKQLLADFDEKRGVQPRSEIDLAKPKSSSRKKTKLRILGFNLPNMLNTGWAAKNADLRNLGVENIVNADIMKTQREIQPGDAKDLEQYDRAGRTVIHRAALEQNYFLVLDLCNQARQKEDKHIQVIDKKDKFGNTPLLLSCILNISESSKKRAKCIEIFLREGAFVNVRNSRTMWTPVMWCAYYGDRTALKILIDKDARCHYPDHKGHFPVDKAAMRVLNSMLY